MMHLRLKQSQKPWNSWRDWREVISVANNCLLFADQTPTPTRFLKNCEEVGLFNELTSPFEHDFKKATEEEIKKVDKHHLQCESWLCCHNVYNYFHQYLDILLVKFLSVNLR